jgi:hypothetical protein
LTVSRTIEIDDDARRETYVNPTSRAGRPAAGSTLRVTGLLVSRADLVAALRAFVPGIVDIATADDGDNFALLLGEREPSEGT